MTRIRRPCINCGRPSQGSRCPRHERQAELRRQARQPYRAAYESPEYKRARRRRLKRSGGRCEALLPSGDGYRQCGGVAQETHHLVPLSTATSLEEAIALCRERYLRAVCWRHNPRGPGALQPIFAAS